MGFTDDVELFVEKLQTRERDVLVNVTTAVRDSITEGSPVTGSPGQPVDLGALKASWQTIIEEEWIHAVITNLEYAPAIENGQQEPYTTKKGTPVTPGPMTLRSAVGGFHSVKLTRAGFQKLVDNELARAGGGFAPYRGADA